MGGQTNEHPRRVNWAFLVAILRLIVAFTGVSYQSIAAYVSNKLFPDPDFKMGSLHSLRKRRDTLKRWSSHDR